MPYTLNSKYAVQTLKDNGFKVFDRKSSESYTFLMVNIYNKRVYYSNESYRSDIHNLKEIIAESEKYHNEKDNIVK